MGKTISSSNIRQLLTKENTFTCLIVGFCLINFMHDHACAEFDGIGRIWKLKKQHKLAGHLSEMLVQKDFSWQNSFHENFQPLIVLPVLSSKSDRIKHIHHMKEMHKTYSEMSRARSYRPIATSTSIPHSKNYTPLLRAAGSGIVEIFGKIIDRFPEAICHVSQDEHNVLHMAVKHRQLKIFNLLKKHSAFKSLTFRITAEGRTLLHQISRMEFYEQHLPGVAFQLQDELRWYEVSSYSSHPLQEEIFCIF